MKFINELKQVVTDINEIGRNLPAVLKQLPELPERNLEYREGAYGITELLSCPIKAEIRRELQEAGMELPVESQEVEDGFLYENLVKLALAKRFGDRFEPEKVLPLDLQLDDGRVFKIDGHLDCFVAYDDGTVVGVEVKHTNLNFDNELTGKPPQVIVLDPNDRSGININYRYFLQAKLQRYCLQKLYPDRKVETYLLVKTQLRTKYKLGKTTIILPVTESVTEEELRNLCSLFLTEKKPRTGWECQLCIYRENGYCSGHKETAEVEELVEDRTELISSLLTRRKELLAELKMVEDQLKKLISEPMEWNGQKIGWLPKVSYTYNLPLLAELIKKKGLKAADYFQVKSAKVKELEKVLGDEIEKARKMEEKKRFVLPR